MVARTFLVALCAFSLSAIQRPLRRWPTLTFDSSSLVETGSNHHDHLKPGVVLFAASRRHAEYCRLPCFSDPLDRLPSEAPNTQRVRHEPGDI